MINPSENQTEENAPSVDDFIPGPLLGGTLTVPKEYLPGVY